jgi:hypothetical protein
MTRSVLSWPTPRGWRLCTVWSPIAQSLSREGAEKLRLESRSRERSCGGQRAGAAHFCSQNSHQSGSQHVVTHGGRLPTDLERTRTATRSGTPPQSTTAMVF